MTYEKLIAELTAWLDKSIEEISCSRDACMDHEQGLVTAYALVLVKVRTIQRLMMGD